jgi:hypothetical protein
MYRSPNLAAAAKSAVKRAWTHLRRRETSHTFTVPIPPEPLGETKAGKVWLADDVKRWIAEHRPTKPQAGGARARPRSPSRGFIAGLTAESSHLGH